jgi:biopolymer transport protein ExbD
MPVHLAGPRLYKSIKLTNVGKSIQGGSRAANVALNLTPFVDMMTILVTFLLMVFSASGEILRAKEGLEMPISRTDREVQKAPVIMISDEDIELVVERADSNTHEIKDVGSVPSLLANPPTQQRIEGLFDELKTVRDDVKANIALGNKKMFTDAQIDACNRENAGDPPDTKVDEKTGMEEVTTYCPDGLVLVQADKNTDARIVNMVVKTAHDAEFKKMLFAVKNDENAL